MKYIGIIPARFASTRFPGKPLANIGGKSMIKRVYEQVNKIIDHVVVATDDQRIVNEVNSFGGKVILTSDLHKSGTDRCAEAYSKYHALHKIDFDVIINIQGDEPFVHPEQIKELLSCFDSGETEIASLISKIQSTDILANSNIPKVVIDKNSNAIYFSRSIIPFIRGKELQNWQASHTFYRHIGMYAFRPNVLKQLVALPTSALEEAESLEQLRWIENGHTIKVALTNHSTHAVDTPEDLEEIIQLMNLK